MALLVRAPGFSACTVVVFLTSPAPACTADTKAGRDGARTGVREKPRGKPWQLWGAAPPLFPPAEPKARTLLTSILTLRCLTPAVERRIFSDLSLGVPLGWG